MKFNPENYRENYFEYHVVRENSDYDYVWTIANVDVHQHKDFYELVILAGGPSVHWYDGEEKQYGKGTVFFFKPGEKHGIYRTSRHSLHLSFFARETFFEHFFDENPILKNAFGRKNYLMCELAEWELEYVCRLANLMEGKENDKRNVYLFLYNVISLLILYNEANRDDTQNMYVIDLLEKFNNYSYLLKSMKDIYALYPIAKSTLITEFKNHTGMTIIQYQRKQKMVYATQLLTHSEISITELANKLNFDVSHFLHVFKAYYGVTPREYRRGKRIKEKE